MAIRPLTHYKPIVVRGDERNTAVAETNDGSSPSYEFGEDSGHTSRTFYTPWSENWEWVGNVRSDIIGSTTIKSTGKLEKYLSRKIPFEHPNLPGTMFANNLHISGRKGKPIGPDAEGVQYFDEAALNIGFSQFPYKFLTDEELTLLTSTYPDEGSLLRYVSIDQQTAAKVQTVPAFNNIVWDIARGAPAALAPNGKPQPLTTKATTLLFEGDLVLTWHEVPYEAVPKTAMAHLVGRTNFADFGHPASIVGTRPAGTLLCGVPKLKMRFLRDGNLGFDITYFFKFYPKGANSFFYAGPLTDPGYYPAANINGSFVYPYDGLVTTFADLFRPEK